MDNEKRTEKTDDPSESERPAAKNLTGQQFAGIVLIAAALFNIPKIVIPAVMTEDQMMLVVLAAMILAGLILLGLPALLKLINSRRK